MPNQGMQILFAISNPSRIQTMMVVKDVSNKQIQSEYDSYYLDLDRNEERSDYSVDSGTWDEEESKDKSERWHQICSKTYTTSKKWQNLKDVKQEKVFVVLKQQRVYGTYFQSVQFTS